MEPNKKEKKPGTVDKRVLAAILGVVALALILAVCLRGCGGEESKPIEEGGVPKQGIQLDENAEEGGLVQRSKEEIQAELNEKVQQGMINISMNTSPVFEDGQSKGNLLIVNSERNNYPQVVYIVRKDTGDEIYRSGAIPVGSKIENAKLSVDLDAGTYDCVAYFNNVDLETGEYLGTAGAEIQITVNK